MRKGILASVAALAAGAGVALGQGAPGYPPSAPPGFPMWPGAGGGAPAVGMPADTPLPEVIPAGHLPHAGGLPHHGPVPSPGAYDPGYAAGHAPHGGGMQLHKAAGGPDHWYLDIEHLAWYPKSQPVRFPLATISPPASGGILGAEGTRVLYGGENIDYDYFNVLRLTVGAWGPARKWGLEFVGFIQEAKGEYFDIVQPVTQTVVVGGRQTIARPLINALTDLPEALLVAVPNVSAGEIHIQSRLKMGGAEANALCCLVYCDRFKLNLLGGVRYIDLDENLQVISRSQTGAGDILDVFDEFATRNQFLGGQLGLQTELRRGRYFMDVIGKVAVGNMFQELVVTGFTNSSAGTTQPGGLLALASNITDETRNRFAVAPELTLKFGYQWTQRISSYIGYNLLYLSPVLRPGDQIDPVVNPIFLPTSGQFGGEFGPIRPVNTFDETDFFVQGVTFGVSIRY